MEIPAVVSSPAGTSDRLSLELSRGSEPTDGPLQQGTPTSSSRTIAPSHLEAIWLRQLAAGVSRETSELLAMGWSNGTNQAYQSAWRRWDSWCAEWQVDPFSCPVHPFLEFLTSLYKEGMKYRLINTIQSAISMNHDHVEGIPMGQHLLVSRLLKGKYNSRPPQPRYSTT